MQRAAQVVELLRRGADGTMRGKRASNEHRTIVRAAPRQLLAWSRRCEMYNAGPWCRMDAGARRWPGPRVPDALLDAKEHRAAQPSIAVANLIAGLQVEPKALVAREQDVVGATTRVQVAHARAIVHCRQSSKQRVPAAVFWLPRCRVDADVLRPERIGKRGYEVEVRLRWHPRAAPVFQSRLEERGTCSVSRRGVQRCYWQAWWRRHRDAKAAAVWLALVPVAVR